MGSRYRYRRRSRNNFGSAISDAASTASRQSARGAFVLGGFGFLLFYLLLPWFLNAWAEYNKAKMTGSLAPIWAKVIDEVFLRRFVYPSELAGIAILVVCSFIGVWKLVTSRDLARRDVQDASFLSRVASRWLD